MFETGPEFATGLDRTDPLRAFRDEFLHPMAPDGTQITYFAGNSLGLQPKRAATVVNEELEKWAKVAIAGHFGTQRPWLSYHEQMAGPIAGLVGAGTHEVVTMNSLTVNLHLMLVSFYRPQGRRHKILIEHHAFPSDHFAVESQIRLGGRQPSESLVLLAPRDGEETLRTTDVLAAIDQHGDELALIMLPGVQYYTGQVMDMAAITAAGHRVGALIGFDLAHAIGNIPMSLHDWDVDFAAWCTYKYLNAGPGSVGGAYVHQRHHGRDDIARLTGWWGHDQDSRFDMSTEFVPIPTVEAWQLSNAPVMSMAPLVASLEVFEKAGGIGPLRTKAVTMSAYLDFLLTEHLADKAYNLTPSEAAARGCQSSIRITAADREGKTVFDQLRAAHIECDWRNPDVIRIAPVPLYNTFSEIHHFVTVLRDLLT